MGNRACPLCFTRVPRSLVLSRSYEIECPACHTVLEVSRVSRILASISGLVLSFVVLEWLASVSETVLWSLQVVAAFVAFGIGAAGLLLFSADLAVRPKAGTETGATFPHAHA